MPSRTRVSILVGSLFALCAGGSALAQPQIAESYRQAAQAYRDAAAQTRCPENRACYELQARYHDALAASLAGGPTPPRETCQPVQCAEDSRGNPPSAASSGSAGAAPATAAPDPVIASLTSLGQQLEGLEQRRQAARRRRAEMEARRENMLQAWIELGRSVEQHRAEPEFEYFAAAHPELVAVLEPAWFIETLRGERAALAMHLSAEGAHKFEVEEAAYVQFKIERVRDLLAEAQAFAASDDARSADLEARLVGTWRGTATFLTLTQPIEIVVASSNGTLQATVDGVVASRARWFNGKLWLEIGTDAVRAVYRFWLTSTGLAGMGRMAYPQPDGTTVEYPYRVTLAR